MSGVARDVAAGAAKRRRDRRYRSFLAVRMATLTACHHSAQKNAVQRHQCTQPVAEYVYVASPPAATRAATSVKTTPQMIRFLDRKVCNNWLQMKLTITEYSLATSTKVDYKIQEERTLYLE